MLPPPFTNALVLTGPTGSGKTALGVELAERLDAEIISMDSMALYRRMNIGTAKPQAAERGRVAHHLIDVLEPWESANVAWWLERAANCCREIEGRGKQVLFVGGTPLYLKSLIYGLFDGPSGDPALRLRLEEQAREIGTPALHERLACVDPAAAARIHNNDLRRIVRALEVYELTGKPISQWQVQWQRRGARSAELSSFRVPRSAFRASQVLWLDVPRKELYEQINRRVDRMFAGGLVEEVRTLRKLDRPLSREALQALGYKEVFAYVDGQATLEETIEQVKIRSRQFAKRQISWFRHLPSIHATTRELTWELWAERMKTNKSRGEGSLA